MAGDRRYGHQIMKSLNTTIPPDVKTKLHLLAICHHFPIKNWRKTLLHHLTKLLSPVIEPNGTQLI